MPANDARRATLTAGSAALLMLAALIVAFGLDVTRRVLAVPSLPAGTYRERVVIEDFRRSTPVPTTNPELVEHTVKESEFTIESKPVPVTHAAGTEPTPAPSPIPDPIPEPAAEPPKPVVKPQTIPKPAPKPVKIKKAKPVAPPAEAAPQEASSGSSAKPASGGTAGSAVRQGNAARSSEDAVLAVIVREIEAKKRYPRRARQTGAEGRVVLRIEIAENGVVSNVEVAERHPSSLLNRAALKAAEDLKGRRLDVRKPLTVSVPVVFTLTGT